MEGVTPTVGEAFRRSATQWPDVEFVVGETERFTYREFDHRVDRLASGLLRLGLRRGDAVACWLANSPSWLVAWLACCRIGVAMVAINTRYKRHEAEFILRQSEAKALIAMPTLWGIDYLGMIGEMRPALPHLETLILWKDEQHDQGERLGATNLETLMAGEPDRAALDAAEAAVEHEDPIIVIYTSGTTGEPKGATHCHRVVPHGHNIARAMRMEAGERMLGHMPLYHVAGCISNGMPALVSGVTLVMMQQWNPGEALDLIERERIAIFGGIPTHFIDLLEETAACPRDTRSLRVAWIGGAPVTPKVAREVKEKLHFDALQAVWGMTETMGVTALANYDDPLDVTCDNRGVAIGDYELRVVDRETGDPLPAGEDGEVQVRGYCVMPGYYRNEAATAESIRSDGWFRTGDLGRMDDAGYLKITGRAKEMFIVGGSNAYPAEIERFLETHPKVSQAFVCGAPHPRLGEVCFAFVMPNVGETVTPDEVIDFARGAIADYKVPRHVEIVADFPRTTTNKIQRFVLQSRVAERFQSAEA